MTPSSSYKLIYVLLALTLSGCNPAPPVETSSQAQSQLTGRECLTGDWVPDQEKYEFYILSILNTAPSVRFSGTMTMSIKDESAELHAEDWAVVKVFGATSEVQLILNGKAQYSMVTTSGATTPANLDGKFHLTQESNAYKQTSISRNNGELLSDDEVSLIKPLLPVGEWASGHWSCQNDLLTFEVTDQNSDGQLLETWQRKK